MKVIDAHCDLLYKMFENKAISFERDDPGVDVTLPRLKQANVAIQFFAIFLSDQYRPSFANVLEYIRIFKEKIITHPDMVHIQSTEDMQYRLLHNKIGAMLTLEGVEGLEGNLTYLHIAYYLGVRFVGITWNHANWAADGVGEARKGGFTNLGKLFVKECEKLGMLLDVSHLSERAFWELMELSHRPFIASHSNAYALCPHPRNLTDEQIRAIIRKDGRIGLTFVPWFVKENDPRIVDVVNHLERVCSLGGARHVGFGSDFDGISHWVPGLENTGKYPAFINTLLNHFHEKDIANFMFNNWNNFLEKHLSRSGIGTI